MGKLCNNGLRYENGLRFECTRCSRCCRHSGYVFLSENDIKQMAAGLGLTTDAFTQKFCKTVARNGVKISLTELANGDCVFYGDEVGGCRVYEHRPLQCRLYPFWEQMVMDKFEWNAEKKTCPGLDCGRLYSKEEIEERLEQRRRDPLIKY